MNFWQSERYLKFESNAQGDILRGLPKNEFPWSLIKTHFRDGDDDAWDVEILALSVAPARQKNSVTIEFQCHASMTLSEKRLESFGLIPQRLRILSLGKIGQFHFQEKHSLQTELENLENDSKRILQLFSENILKNYKNSKKLLLLQEQAKNGALSRFASSFDA